MGIPRRGARTIVVAGARYRWRVTEPESWRESAAPWTQVLETRRLTLVVQCETGDGPKLLAWVPVYRRAVRKDLVETPRASGATALSTPRQEVSVTPALVRQLIEHALREGWTPNGPGAELVLPADAVDRSIRATLDVRMSALIAALSDRLDVRLLTQLALVGERPLMLELLCEQLHEDDRALSQDVLDKLMGLAGELRVDRAYTSGLAARVMSRTPAR